MAGLCPPYRRFVDALADGNARYEARKFGVRSTMPSITAKRQCPDLIFVKPRFDAYKAVSLQVQEIVTEYRLWSNRYHWMKLISMSPRI